MANYSDIKLTSLPEREMELSGLITVEKMAEMRKKALAKFKESVEIPGFRKGNAPEASIISKIGEMRILEEAAELALSEEYPNILEEHKIDALGRPEIAITKLAAIAFPSNLVLGIKFMDFFITYSAVIKVKSSVTTVIQAAPQYEYLEIKYQ